MYQEPPGVLRIYLFGACEDCQVGRDDRLSFIQNESFKAILDRVIRVLRGGALIGRASSSHDIRPYLRDTERMREVGIDLGDGRGVPASDLVLPAVVCIFAITSVLTIITRSALTPFHKAA
jgi:hypothetical protein